MTAASSSPLRLFARAYLVVAATTAADGLIALLFAPYLASRGIALDLIGLLLAAHGVAALASRLPSGLLYRPHRARALLVVALALAASAALLLPRADHPLGFALLRLTSGATFGVATTTSLARFIDALPAGIDRARAMGYFSAALALGLTCGNGLAGFLGEYLGYAIAFHTAAAFYALGAAVALTLPPVSAPLATRETGTAGWSPRAAVALARDPALVTIVLGAFLGAFMQMISGGFLPLYGLSIGLTLSEVGLVRVGTALTNVVARSGAGVLAQRVGRRRVQHIGIALQALGLMTLSVCTTLWALALTMLWVAAWRAIVLVANTVGLTEDVDERRVGRGMAAGLFNAAIDLGNLASPALGGYIAEQYGLATMFRVMPVGVLALYAVVNLALARWGHQAPRPRAVT
ncbi:MAG TPA: MFS transporter [Chloroflexota bacterium]|jgi:DHA1 family multidrug resistance protein-like MFS transporter|nr:MFS transporter [Chloroflexota bacterium]